MSKKTHPVKAAFYNAKDLKEIKTMELPISVERFDIDFKYFSDGTLYFTINDSRLCKVNRQMLSAEEVSPDSYKNIPGLESGFAKIEFWYDLESDFFKVISNQGKEIYYYPIIAKSYNGFYEHTDAKRNIDLMPGNSPVLTRFVFSSQNSDYKDEKVQLVKYHLKATPGYPLELPIFSWSKTIDGQKKFIDKHWEKWSRITDYINFTPERLYFGPKVIGYNDKMVVITYKVTPAENEKFIIQVLDANDAKVLWTVQTDESYGPNYALIAKDGVLVSYHDHKSVLYDHNGK